MERSFLSILPLGGLEPIPEGIESEDEPESLTAALSSNARLAVRGIFFSIAESSDSDSD